MQLKFCIAKMVGTSPVYQTDTINTWVSDITDSTVKWYLSEGAAREALGGPEAFVVPYEDITLSVRCESLTLACEALAEAIRVGAVWEIPSYAALYVHADVFHRSGVRVEEVTHGEISTIEHGHIAGIPVSCQTLTEVSE